MKQNGFTVELIKTTKVDISAEPEDLPPKLGHFDEFKVSEYPGCPKEWSKDGVFVKIEENEPLWFDLQNNPECACLPSVQKLNPITGQPANLEDGLTKDPVQNYLKLPEQLWLDGYVKDGKVYQFVATKAGEALAVNEFTLPKHMQDSHALGFAFFAPKVERNTSGRQSTTRPWWLDSLTWPTRPWWLDNPTWPYVSMPDPYSQTVWSSPLRQSNEYTVRFSARCCDTTPNDTLSGSVGMDMDRSNDNKPVESKAEVGVTINTKDILKSEDANQVDFDKASMGMGGRIKQRITPDDNSVDYYHEKPDAVLTVYLVLPEQFDAIMKVGQRQDDDRKDKYLYSGEVGGVQVPLINSTTPPTRGGDCP